MKIARKILVFLCLVIFILIAGSILLSYLYKDKITSLILTELNKNVKTEITASSIDFSILKKFPFASLEFKNILAKASPQFSIDANKSLRGDTLFSLKSLFLEFSLLDLIKKNYRILIIHAVSGSINLAEDKSGHANYEFWKSNKTDTKEYYNLHLQNVRFNDVSFTFIDFHKNFLISAQIQKSNLKGDFSSSKYDMLAKFSGKLLKIMNDSIILLQNQDCSGKLNLKITEKLIELADGHLILSGNDFSVKGKYLLGESDFADLLISSDKLSAAAVLDFIPQKDWKKVIDLKGNDLLKFNASLKGYVSNGRFPHLEVHVYPKKSYFTVVVNGVVIKNLRFVVYFNNGLSNRFSSSVLKIDKLSGIVDGDLFEGSANIANLNAPDFLLQWKGNVKLSTIHRLFPNDTLKYFTGQVAGFCEASGHLKNPKHIKSDDFAHFLYRGNLVLSKILVHHPHILFGISEFSGKLNLDKEWLVQDAEINYKGNHLTGSGNIQNFLPWILLNNETLSIKGDIFCEDFNFDNIIKTEEKEKDKQDTSGLSFPESLLLDINFKAHNFVFGRFHASNVAGKITYQPEFFDLRSLYFETMEGNLSGSGIFLQKPDKSFILRTQNMLEKINITTLFYTFHNFGQSLIEDKHMKGKISGFVDFSSEWDKSLKIRPELVLVDGNIKIEKGELIDYEPLNGLSKYLNVDELKHIYFSTLQNDIFIKNRLITIPQMDINSETFDLVGSGTHDFDNNFNYKIRVSLSESLYNKAKKSNNQIDEYGIMETEGTRRITLPMTIKGNINNYKISYDARQATQQMIQNLKKEKNQLKSLLNEEFGLFKKDSASLHKSVTKEKDKFVIEWDEEKYQAGQKTPPAGDKKKNKIKSKKNSSDTSKIKVEWQ